MKKVAILAPEQSVIQAIADPQYCFSAVNMFLVSAGKKPLFDVCLVGINSEVKLFNNQYSVFPDRLITQRQQYDLVVIPALFGNMEEAIRANLEFVPWIKKQYANGAELASLCVGAFLLSATGLLNGKKCSTHWHYIDQMKALFPEVEVQEGSIVTDEHGIYSSGGANSYWNLLLHITEKYVDRETAVLVSKFFAVDINRSSQAAYSMFKAQHNHSDEIIKMAQMFIEQHVTERLTVDSIARRFAMGRRSLERRFKQATHNSVLEYIHRVKMEAAKRAFENGSKTVHQIMFEVGYSDTKAFRTAFKKVTGLTPLKYRNRYVKNEVMDVLP
jgi:transcriptional regulator GlxA family with amidase domain